MCENQEIEAMRYARDHELVRPRISWIRFSFVLLLHEIFIGVVVFWKGNIFTFFLLHFLSFVFFGKYLLKFLVRCYQRYASEKTRRRCICKPSCSEYALLVLDKYFLFVAIYKIYYRLVYTCKGKYKVDQP